MTDVESESEAESPGRMATGMDEPDEGRDHLSLIIGLSSALPPSLTISSIALVRYICK